MVGEQGGEVKEGVGRNSSMRAMIKEDGEEKGGEENKGKEERKGRKERSSRAGNIFGKKPTKPETPTKSHKGLCSHLNKGFPKVNCHFFEKTKQNFGNFTYQHLQGHQPHGPQFPFLQTLV